MDNCEDPLNAPLAPLVLDDELKQQQTETAPEVSDFTLRLLQGLSLLCVFLFSGIIFGWQSLLLVLQRQGAYHELCEEGSPLDEICSEQKAALNLIFTFGSTMLSVIALPAGLFIDHFGPCIATAVSSISLTGGLCLMGLSDSKNFAAFTPAYCLLAIGGLFLMFSAFRCAFLPKANPVMVMAAVSCLFDASCVVFLLFEFGEERVGWISLKNFMFSWAVVSLVLTSLLGLLWRRCEGLLMRGPPVAEQSSAPSDLPLQERPVMLQMKSLEFYVLLVFATVSLMRANMYIGTQDLLLDYLGDDDHTYAKIFSVVLPCGPLMVPVIECFQITLALGAVYNSLTLVKSLPVQIAAFVFYTSFRAFLYSVLASFTAEMFGMRTLGRIQGTVFTIAGIFNLVQYALVALVQGPLDGNPFWVNVGQLAALLPLALLIEILRKKHQTDKSSGTEWGTESPCPSPISAGSPGSVPLPSAERPFLARMCSNQGSPSLTAKKHWGVLKNAVHATHLLKEAGSALADEQQCTR